MAVAATVAGSPVTLAAQELLLDRVVARVGGVAITQTDVEAAIGFGIVDLPPGADPFAAGTRAMIDRQLLLAEVARFPPVEPAPLAVAEEVAAMRARAGARLDALVRDTGLDEARLRDLARDTLRIQAYLDQRFGATPQVGAQEVRDYYDTHPEEFTRDGVRRPFAEVEADARAAAARARRRESVGQWVAGLRARGDVVDLTARPARP